MRAAHFTRSAVSAARASAGAARGKHTVVLVRHGESIWNMENRFTGPQIPRLVLSRPALSREQIRARATGWYDVALSEKGHAEAAEGGRLLNAEGFQFDVAYTSTLKRAIRTCYHALEGVDQTRIPTVKAWQLNERCARAPAPDAGPRAARAL